MFGTQIAPWLNQGDKLYPTVLIKGDQPSGTTVTLGEMLPDDVTHIVLRRLNGDEFYEWENSEIKNLAPTFGCQVENIRTTVSVSADRKTLDFSNATFKSWFGLSGYIVMIPVKKVSSSGSKDTNMHRITDMPLAGSHASVSIDLNADSGVLPCYSEIVKAIRLGVYCSKLPGDTDVNIANVKIEA